LGKKEGDIREDISRTGKSLTSIMDRMRAKLDRDDDPQTWLALKALASAQGQLLKANLSLDPSNKIPLVVGEKLEHFIAKNNVVKELSVEDILDEVPIGDSRVDVIGRISREYIIIEAETIATKCIGKVEKIKSAIANILSGKTVIPEGRGGQILSKIKRQVTTGKPIRLIFAVSRRPYKSTLRDIKKTEDSMIKPEVYYVNREPPFEISSNLLQ
jgi:hypothetical protein